MSVSTRRIYLRLKMRTLHCIETSIPNHQLTRRNTAQEKIHTMKQIDKVYTVYLFWRMPLVFVSTQSLKFEDFP